MPGFSTFWPNGYRAYLDAVEDAFGADVDYAQLVKIYGEAPDAFKVRYSQSECFGAFKVPVQGGPDRKHISTSYAERQNLLCSMDDIAALVEAAAPALGKQRSYRPRTS